MRPSRISHAVLIALLVAACGGSGSRPAAPAKASTTTVGAQGAEAGVNQAASSSGRVTSSDGSFQTVIPAGFQDARGQESVINALYLVVGVPHMAIDVVRARAPANVNLTQFADDGLQGLKRISPYNQDFSQITSLTVAGAPARSFSYVGRTPDGRTAVEAQINVLHDGWAYGIDGSAPSNRFKAIQAAIGRVLANWHWTSG